MGAPVLVSVIVPAYNAEKTIGKSVESILAQNYSSFELILIDDGSTDRTSVICDDYAARDERVRVIHTSNQGVAAARNTALRNAEGEYVCFVDADDWVKVSYVGNLIGGFSNDVDVVIAYPQYHGSGNIEIPNYPPLQVNTSNFEGMFFNNNIDWHTAPWAKMFRMELICNNNICFPEDMKLGEDCVFFLKYLIHSNGVQIISSTDYCYNAYSDGTLTKRRYEIEYEQLLCSRIVGVTDELINVKNIKAPIALTHLWRLKNRYIKRVLDSVYFGTKTPNRSKRLEIIKSFGYEPFRNIIKGDTIQGNIVNFILKCRMYWLYDFLRMLAKRIKR